MFWVAFDLKIKSERNKAYNKVNNGVLRRGSLLRNLNEIINIAIDIEINILAAKILGNISSMDVP